VSDRPPTGRHLGLDLGATNLKWAVVEHGGGSWSTLAHDQVPTRIVLDPDAVPAAIVAQLAEVAAATIDAWGPVASIGVGVPGVYDPETGCTIFLPNIPGQWQGRPVAGPISAALDLPAFLINDARAFGLAELRLGAGRGASSMVGLTLGTGVGGVIAIDGRVYLGHDGTAGEVGHQTVDPDGPLCNCGNRGCVEVFARADAIAAACGTSSVEEAVRAATDGDARALDGLARVGRYLGIGIANVVTVLTPDRVVLGGGVAAAGEILFASIRAELDRRVRMTGSARVELVQAELGTWAGAIGAAIHGAEAEARPPGLACQPPRPSGRSASANTAATGPARARANGQRQ
jgi:glucokinase